MKRALVILWIALALPSASRAVDLGYAIGGGVALPVDGRLDELSGIGPHVDLGIAYKLLDYLSVALHLSADFPLAEELPNGVTPESRFIGIDARVMAHGGDFFKYWGSVGVGLYFNALSECSANNVCVTNQVAKPGLDLSAGIGFTVYEKLSLGPAVGITFPSFGDFSDIWFLHGSLRFHWNL